MARRFPRGPHPDAVAQLTPPGASRILRLRWWLIAPALVVVAALGAMLYIRAQFVSFADLREQHADTQRHLTPWFLWVSSSPDGVVVAAEPGGEPLPGAWEFVADRFLGGAFVIADADGTRDHVGWTGEYEGWKTSVDGIQWRRAQRRAVPTDFDVLGQDPDLVGRWRVGASEGNWVDLRNDGTMLDSQGADIGRWAGGDEVILTHRNEGWRHLALHVFVSDGYDLAELDADVIYASRGECEIDVLFRSRE